jgi:hypothetical protein
MVERTAWRDTARGLSGAEVSEDGLALTGQIETGLIRGRENRGRWVSRSDGWPDRMARHGAERHRAQGLTGAEGREQRSAPTGQGEIGVV